MVMPRVIQKLGVFEAMHPKFELSAAAAEGERYWQLGETEANLKVGCIAMKKPIFETRGAYAH